MQTRRLLGISMALNLLLLGATGYLLTRKTGSPQPQADAQSLSPAVALAQAMPTPSPLSPPPFAWSQVEAADYPTYISNLRAIHCPEQTIRDIIVADVESLYLHKRQELQAQRPQSGADAGFLREALDKLRQEQSNLIITLFGLKPESASSIAQDTAQPTADPNSSNASASTAAEPLEIPAVLADPAPLNLDEQQQAQMAALRRSFIEAIGGTSQNPDDPGYLHRWQKAQAVFDERFRAIFGQDAYYQQQKQSEHLAQSIAARKP